MLHSWEGQLACKNSAATTANISVETLGLTTKVWLKAVGK